jgi:hypothetical protein
MQYTTTRAIEPYVKTIAIEASRNSKIVTEDTFPDMILVSLFHRSCNNVNRRDWVW